MLGLVEGGKLEYPEKNPQSKDKNQQQTQPTYNMASTLEIKSGPHWWEGSALTTAPFLLQNIILLVLLLPMRLLEVPFKTEGHSQNNIMTSS